MNNVRNAVAKRIQELLEEKHITQYRLAMNSGLAHSTISTIMNSDSNDVRLSKVISIAGGFDMTVSQFLDSPLFDEENLYL